MINLDSIQKEILGKNTSDFNEKNLDVNKLLETKKIISGMFVDVNFLNNLFDTTNQDISVINTALEEIYSNINNSKTSLIKDTDALNLKLSQLHTKYHAYKIHTSNYNNDIYSIVEDYNSTSDIVEIKDLDLNTISGRLYLKPIGNIKIQPINSLFSYSSETGSVEYGSISNIFDEDSDSYFSYSDDYTSNTLTLSITINFKKSETLNQISITPNNFNTSNYLILDSIIYSNDGINYSSIYNYNGIYTDHILNSLTSPTELNPNNNGGSNIFNFYFQPIIASSITFTFTQKKLHPIDNRYKIGLFDISMYNSKYAESGYVVFKKKIDNVKNIKTLGISSVSLTDIDSNMLKTNYYISFNNNTWYQIRPIESNIKNSIPELLYINSSWQENNISVDEKDFKDYIYIKIEMSRNTSVSDLKKILASTTLKINESFDISKEIPSTIKLSNKAIEASISAIISPYVSAGRKNYNRMSIGTTVKNKNTYLFNSPIKLLGTENIYIGDIKLDTYDSLETLYYTNTSAVFIDTIENQIIVKLSKEETARISQYYTDDWLTPILSNSNNTTSPAVLESYDNSTIYVEFQHDVVSPSGNILRLNRISDGNKSTFKVWRMFVDENNEIIKNVFKEIIPAGIKSVPLSYTPLKNLDIIVGGGSYYQVQFVDGVTEFINADEYAFSIDYTNKYLYLRDILKVDVSIEYTAERIIALSSNDFSLSDNQTIILSGFFSDKAIYKIEYNIAVELQNSFLNISSTNSNTILTLSKDIDSYYFKDISKNNKSIIVSYNYLSNLETMINEIKTSITPILDKTIIKYAVI